MFSERMFKPIYRGNLPPASPQIEEIVRESDRNRPRVLIGEVDPELMHPLQSNSRISRIRKAIRKLFI